MKLQQEVADALAGGRPVVALESTIFSRLGLPSPHNAVALEQCCSAVRDGGAVPAVTAVLDGEVRVGLDHDEHERILGDARKIAARDLGPAVAAGVAVGATTVSASLRIADAAGIRVFATGGIGGVHRGADRSFDISADLGAVAAHRVVTVCAGPKYFLDLAATLEVLETNSVPVLGYRTDELPAFYSPHSGLGLHDRVDSPADAAAVASRHWELGGGGVLLTVPIPGVAALERSELDAVLLEAEAETAGQAGADLTPAVLAATARRTGGRSVAANLALAEHNAAVAALVAVALGASADRR